jgi:hypothetical protein
MRLRLPSTKSFPLTPAITNLRISYFPLAARLQLSEKTSESQQSFNQQIIV